jgi:hypothetical protein
VLTRETQPTILGEVEVGVIIQLSLKGRHNKMSLTPYQWLDMEIQKSV